MKLSTFCLVTRKYTWAMSTAFLLVLIQGLWVKPCRADLDPWREITGRVLIFLAAGAVLSL